MLNDILKLIHNNAPDEIIRRGKKIFHTNGVSIVNKDHLLETISFNVKHDLFPTSYRVTVNNYVTTQNLNTRCNCSYNRGKICRHEAAALFQLNELLISGYFEDIAIEYDQSHTLVRMRQISDHHLKLYTNNEFYQQAQLLAKKANTIQISKAEDDTVEATVKDGNKKHHVKLYQNAERYFETSCDCHEKEYVLCIHKVALFHKLLSEHGPNYFSTLRNWDKEKNRLLAAYGYTLDDELRGKFAFTFDDGKLIMRVLNMSIKKLSDPNHPKNIEAAIKKDVEIEDGEKIILLLNQNEVIYPHLSWSMVAVKHKDGVPFGAIKTIDSEKILTGFNIPDVTKQITRIIPRLEEGEMIKAIKRDMPFGAFVDNLGSDLEQVPQEPLYTQVWEYQWPKISKLLEQYHIFSDIFLLEKGKSELADNLKPLSFLSQPFSVSVFAKKINKGKSYSIQLQAKIVINNEVLNTSEYTLLHNALLIYKGALMAIDNIAGIQIINEYGLDNVTEITKTKWQHYLEHHLLPLNDKIQLQFTDDLQEKITDIIPTLNVQVKEVEDKFVFIPAFQYNDVTKRWQELGPALKAVDGKVIIYERNEAVENEFLNELRYLHPNMQDRRKLQGFILASKDALRRGWYFEFLELMKARNVTVLGYDQLKQMRINPNKAVTHISFTTGIDWFEANMEVAFGDQKVTLADISKAISNETNLVKLKDGSKGLITEDFLEEYGLLLKLGRIDGDKIKISKIHFNVLDGITGLKENEEVLKEVEEKKEKLINFDYEGNTTIALPANLDATLRPYQQAGYQWMNFLQETNWGGILADDMGLGKTIQTLSILLKYYNKNKKAKFLVACPTTLIYNWQNESKKFTPDIKIHIYHGSDRKNYTKEFEKANLIITTYGTLRSDIDIFSNMEWDYVVLDESQAVKNPVSQIAKSVLKLNAKNRLALSGTPVQNNTFDLYAQMNFLNPGMLGSIDFFKNEFATPIDKMQDEIAKHHLKKLIYPFLLRRTKEQVATDLPPKVETVLYCEMDTKQRKIYDAYRNKFRSQILGSIQEVGIERSQMSILTGLMKLRQICDSPAILNEQDKFENHSIKIQELMRELKENMSNHKTLVFSQFIGMLDLIRKELDKEGIKYAYFDGSTTSKERERNIQKFQEDEEYKVFLISLKAGGVGLNLTAADYVYIVDPWWNPAVEQQAIDRTHRIGQTKNIFAYRMICKDTIEEKILLLQDRKKSLAKDLISDDSAFLKKLKIEDIEYLLS